MSFTLKAKEKEKMKAIKGCTNPECKAFKKIHYKQDDLFCPKCGEELSFVCAACGKAMERGDRKNCISCQAEKEQNDVRNLEKAKQLVAGALAGVGIVAAAAKGLAQNADVIAESTKKFVNAAEKIVKVIK